MCLDALTCPTLLKKERSLSLIFFPSAMGKSVLAQPDGGTIPLNRARRDTVYYISTVAQSQLILDSCLSSIFRWRVHSAETPSGERLRWSGQRGWVCPAGKTQWMTYCFMGLLSRHTERTCARTPVLSPPLTDAGSNWLRLVKATHCIKCMLLLTCNGAVN